jgi:hypothetical protein
MAGVRVLSQEQLFAAVAAHRLVLAEPAVDRHSFKQRVITGVASYFRFFLPSAGWTLLGTEVTADGCRFDVVWETPEKQVIIDEIKAWRVETRLDREAVEEQLPPALAAAQGTWGSRFVGIRVLWIGAPLHSVLVRPDGAREQLWEVT